jgi:Concanavalin A-like lectin/glucanases superfamily
MNIPSIPSSVNFYVQYTPDQVTPPQSAPIVASGTTTTLTVSGSIPSWANRAVIVGPGIAAGTTVTYSGSGSTLTLSQALTASQTSKEFILVGSQSSTVAWSGYSDWIQDITIRTGRQHYLDRMESATMELTIDNRLGTFSGSSVIVPRLPILVTATYNGYTYAIFNGIVESVDTRLQDQLNAEIMVRATDNLKFLALKYVNNTAFYATYVPQYNASTSTTGATNWYRMNSNTSYGGTCVDALPYDATTSPGSGINGFFSGQVSLQQQGVLLYEDTTCADLTNGTGTGIGSTANGSIALPEAICYAIDFWFIGQGTAGQTITSDIAITYSTTSATTKLWVNSAGQLVLSLNISTTPATLYDLVHPTPVNDGLWHHLAIGLNGSGYISLYVDGISVTYVNATVGPVLSLDIGSNTIDGFCYLGTRTPQLTAYIDEVVISILGAESNNIAILDGQIKARYLAGRLLRQDQNSGDRIAEILVAGGFGSLSINNASYPATVTVNPSNLYVDSPWSGVSSYAYVPNGTLNGTVWVQGLTSPVTTNTCQDLILGITDTEVGNFHQSPAGMFMLRTRDYPYTVANATTSQAILADSSVANAVHYDAQSFDFARDDVDTWTVIVVTPQNGAKQTYNTGLGYLYGDSTYTKSGTQNNDLVSAKQTANYLGYIFQSPLPRVAAVEIRSEQYNSGGTTAAIYQSLNRGLEDRITLYYSPTGVGSPAWAPADSPTTNHSDFLIEAIEHRFSADPGQWITTYTLDPYPLRFDQQDGKTVAQFGSTGVVDNNYVFL